MERSIGRLFFVFGLLGALASCSGGDGPSTPPVVAQPSPSSSWAVGPVINGVNYSPGVVWSGDSFTFPNAAPGVHALTRSWDAVARGHVVAGFRIDGDATFTEVDAGGGTPGPGKVRLFLQRCGDDWGGGAKASYRFYSPPFDLVVGDSKLSVALTDELWTNVNGQSDPDGFVNLLNDLCVTGFGFGGVFAMHGVYANGAATFNLISFVVE